VRWAIAVHTKALVFKGVGMHCMVEWGKQEYEGVVLNEGTIMG